MLKVVRRDNNQCQICGRILRDNEIEFDHIIPVSKEVVLKNIIILG